MAGNCKTWRYGKNDVLRVPRAARCNVPLAARRATIANSGSWHSVKEFAGEGIGGLAGMRCLQNVQCANQPRSYRAGVGVLPLATRPRCSQVDGAAADRAGKERITPRSCRYPRETNVRF